MSALAKLSSSPARRAPTRVPAHGLTGKQRRDRALRLPSPGGLKELGAVDIHEQFENVDTGETFETVTRTLRRIDQLDEERRHERISAAGYIIGRELQVMFESLQRSGSSWVSAGGGRSDVVQAQARRMASLTVGARASVAETDLLIGTIGRAGAEVLKRWLSGTTFRQLAGGDIAGLVPVTEKRVTMMGDRVRWLLEEVASAKAAVGPSRSRGVVAEGVPGWFGEGSNGPEPEAA